MKIQLFSDLWEASDDDSVMDVLYKSGFNSQSAFHRFFKRLVGVTPSQYRQQLQRDSAAQGREVKK